MLTLYARSRALTGRFGSVSCSVGSILRYTPFVIVTLMLSFSFLWFLLFDTLGFLCPWQYRGDTAVDGKPWNKISAGLETPSYILSLSILAKEQAD